jgi:hypothetical protein
MLKTYGEVGGTGVAKTQKMNSNINVVFTYVFAILDAV